MPLFSSEDMQERGISSFNTLHFWTCRFSSNCLDFQPIPNAACYVISSLTVSILVSFLVLMFYAMYLFICIFVVGGYISFWKAVGYNKFDKITYNMFQVCSHATVFSRMGGTLEDHIT